MSNAFRCDGCREFYSGKPAFEGQVRGRTYTHTTPDTGDKYNPSHHGGVDDIDPVGEPDMVVNWPERFCESKMFEFCGECFVFGMLDAVHETVARAEVDK